MPPTTKLPSGSTLICQSLWQISRACCDYGWDKTETVRIVGRKKPRFDRGSRRYSSSSRGFRTGDLLGAVTKRPEDLVGFSMRRSAKEWVDVFPNDLSVSGDFEKASEGSFVDQRVAVEQALSVAHAGREKVRNWPILIGPDDFVDRWIALDHPRKRQRIIEPMDAVVENQDVAA